MISLQKLKAVQYNSSIVYLYCFLFCFISLSHSNDFVLYYTFDCYCGVLGFIIMCGLLNV